MTSIYVHTKGSISKESFTMLPESDSWRIKCSIGPLTVDQVDEK